MMLTPFDVEILAQRFRDTTGATATPPPVAPADAPLERV